MRSAHPGEYVVVFYNGVGIRKSFVMEKRHGGVDEGVDRDSDIATRTRNHGRGRQQDLGLEDASNFVNKRLGTKPKTIAKHVDGTFARVMAHPRNDVVVKVQWAAAAMEKAEEVNLGKKLTGKLFAEGRQGLDKSHFLFVKVGRSEGVVDIGVNVREEFEHEFRVGVGGRQGSRRREGRVGGGGRGDGRSVKRDSVGRGEIGRGSAGYFVRRGRRTEVISGTCFGRCIVRVG